MTIQEALLKARDGDLWARPLSWRGCGMGLAAEDGGKRWKLVPTIHGGQAASLPSTSEVCGAWEALSPDLILKETP